jgi:hypothetical protein
VHPQRLQQPSELEARWASLITDPKSLRVAERLEEPPQAHLISEETIDLGGLPARREHPRRDRVLVDIQTHVDQLIVLRHTAHGQLLAPYVAPSASSWTIHVAADRSRPFHAD